MTDVSRTAWTTDENSTRTPDGRGGFFTLPNYIDQCNKKYPKLLGANWGTKYYVMMLGEGDPDIADAIGNNWINAEKTMAGPNNGFNEAYVDALEKLEDKYGPLYQFQRDSDPATACALLNFYDYPTEWPIRFGSFDFRSLAPGEPTAWAFEGAIEAPADSPVPPTWPTA